MDLNDTIIDELLKDTKSSEDLLGDDGFLFVSARIEFFRILGETPPKWQVSLKNATTLKKRYKKRFI